MLDRRAVIRRTAKVCAGAMLSRTMGYAGSAWAQAAGAKTKIDEMGLNTQAHQESAPPPDFGPLPKALPREALAVRDKASLGGAAAQHGLLAGTAIHVESLDDDPAYRELVADQARIVAPERVLKWDVLRPAPDKYSFEAADAYVNFAEKHYMKVRGHTLVWHNELPDWFGSVATPDNARQMLKEHIATVVGRYRGRIHSWDVVNEAVFPPDGRPDKLRNSAWMKLLGPEYIEIAYRATRETDPKALLTYNDYGVEYDSEEQSERRAAILELLRNLKARNCPLDAVGIQGHIKAASPYKIGNGLREYMAALRGMGLQIFLTEMDVNEDDIKDNDVAVRDRQVADTYREFLSVAMQEPALKAVLTWGITDRYTWLNSGPTHKRKQPNRPQRSLPFDPQYRPTPAFFAMRDSFEHRT